VPDFKMTNALGDAIEESDPDGAGTQPCRDHRAVCASWSSILRQHRTELREEWARRITEAKVLTAMSDAEIFAEATSVYDNYVAALENGNLRGAADLLAQTCPSGSFPAASRRTR